MNYLYLALLVGSMAYLIPVLFIRIGLNQRNNGERRLLERRVVMVHMPIERRRNLIDRREETRRN